METQKPFILIGFRQEKMKKNIILSAAAILAGCLFISGCDNIADEFTAPKDTWVYKDSTKSDKSFTYTWGEGENEKSVEFDLYVNYATKDTTVNFDGTPAEVKPGVNVILVPSANNNNDQKNYLKELLEISGVDNIAMFKSFGEQSVASESESDPGKSISLSGIWTLVYKFNRFDKVSTPIMNKLTSEYTLITEVKETLNWKRVLYNMLGEKLFSEN